MFCGVFKDVSRKAKGSFKGVSRKTVGCVQVVFSGLDGLKSFPCKTICSWGCIELILGFDNYENLSSISTICIIGEKSIKNINICLNQIKLMRSYYVLWLLGIFVHKTIIYTNFYTEVQWSVCQISWLRPKYEIPFLDTKGFRWIHLMRIYT